MFMRELRVYHEVPMSYLDKSELKAVGTRWVCTNKGDAANPFIRARLVAQETKRVSELTPQDASGTFAATPPLESLKVMLSRCMTGKRRTTAAEKVLGFHDISRAHFHSPARRTIVTKVPKEDDECTSGYAALDKAMYVSFERSCHVCVRHDDDFVVSGTRTQQKNSRNICPSISSSSILPHWDHMQEQYWIPPADLPWASQAVTSILPWRNKLSFRMVP